MNIAANVTLALACTAALVVNAIASQPHSKGGHDATQHAGAGAAAQYAGQDKRAVASLSQQDVDDLLAGRGWGLAKPAELNGYPGPLHVIELAAELGLSDGQRQRVQAAFDRMKAKAIEVGARYVAAEQTVDAAFRAGATQGVVAERVAEAEKLRGVLRLVHLDAHLEVTPLLTAEQRTRYGQLRGYGAAQHSGHSPGHGHGEH